MHVFFPSIVIEFMATLIPILGFDVLERFLDWESQTLIDFDFDRQDSFSNDKIFFQIVEIGYECPNSIILLNTLAVVLLLYVLKFIILAQVSAFVFLTKGKYGGKKLKQKLVN